MIAKTIKQNARDALALATQTILRGGNAVIPTETSYGLACDATNARAVKRVYAIKGRSKQKSLPVIVSSIKMMKKCVIVTKPALKLIKRFMPGPLTLVLKKKGSKLPSALSKQNIAVRISSNSFARSLTRRCGMPLTATSANLSGGKPCYSIKEATKIFSEKIDLIIDAGTLKQVRPSTIFDLTRGKPRILRQGPISEKQIFAVLGELK